MKKAKRFAAGGYGVGPSDGPVSIDGGFGGGGGDATSGLKDVMTGASTIKGALGNVQSAIGGGGGDVLGSTAKPIFGGGTGSGSPENIWSIATNARNPTFKKGGKVSSASSRGDGIAQRGKTKGRYL